MYQRQCTHKSRRFQLECRANLPATYSRYLTHTRNFTSERCWQCNMAHHQFGGRARHEYQLHSCNYTPLGILYRIVFPFFFGDVCSHDGGCVLLFLRPLYYLLYIYFFASLLTLFPDLVPPPCVFCEGSSFKRHGLVDLTAGMCASPIIHSNELWMESVPPAVCVHTHKMLCKQVNYWGNGAEWEVTKEDWLADWSTGQVIDYQPQTFFSPTDRPSSAPCNIIKLRWEKKDTLMESSLRTSNNGTIKKLELGVCAKRVRNEK